jgi:hypothetical protein
MNSLIMSVITLILAWKDDTNEYIAVSFTRPIIVVARSKA